MNIECHGLDTPECVRFYERDFYPLSNFSAFRLYWRGLDFDTSEHAYHWEKFNGQPKTAEQVVRQASILNARSAHAAFKIAERHKADRRPDWDDIKVSMMYQIIRAKA